MFVTFGWQRLKETIYDAGIRRVLWLFEVLK